jgi:hypothetical protein
VRLEAVGKRYEVRQPRVVTGRITVIDLIGDPAALAELSVEIS